MGAVGVLFICNSLVLMMFLLKVLFQKIYLFCVNIVLTTYASVINNAPPFEGLHF